MTKHWPEQRPSLCHLGDHHLDFQRNALQTLPALTRSSPDCIWSLIPPQQPVMEKPPGSPQHQDPQDADPKSETVTSDSKSTVGKKKNYQRYPKPPYSYLAMIAMVIQRSPDKKLTLSEVRLTLRDSYIQYQLLYCIFRAIWQFLRTFYAQFPRDYRCVLLDYESAQRISLAVKVSGIVVCMPLSCGAYVQHADRSFTVR